MNQRGFRMRGHYDRSFGRAALSLIVLPMALLVAPVAAAEGAASPGDAAAQAGGEERLILALGDPQPGACEAAARELAKRGEAFGDLVCQSLAGALSAMVELHEMADPRAVEPLVAALQNPIVEIRAAAAKTLGVLGDPEAFEALTEALSDSSATVRSSAAEALARSGDEAAIPGLVVLAGDESRSVRKSAREALDRLGEPLGRLIRESLAGSEEAIGELVERQDDRAAEPFVSTLVDEAEEPEVRSAAARALARLEGESAVDRLVVCLGYSVARLRDACASALEVLGEPWGRLLVDSLAGAEEAREALVRQRGDPRIIPPLLNALDDLSPKVRIAAAKTLASIAEPDSFEALQEVFWNSSAEERLVVANALATIDRSAFVSNLYGGLESRRTETVMLAATALGLVGETRSLAPLIRLLDHEDPQVRIAAAGALGALADPRAVPPLVDVLADSDPGVRQAAATALGSIGEKQAIDPLVSSMGDRDPEVRRTMASALWQLGEPLGGQIHRALEGNREATSSLATRKDRRAVQPLLDAFTDSHAITRRAALRALGEIGDPRSIEVMIETLQESDEKLRHIAVSTLSRIGDEQAVDGLVELMDEEDTALRQSAAKALAAIGGPRASEALLGALFDDEARVRESAVWAMGQFVDPRATERLIELLTDPVARVRRASCWAVGRIGDEAALGSLVRRLRDRDSLVRQASVWALGEIGGQTAIDALIGAVVDTDPDVAMEARQALDLAGEPLGGLILDSVEGSRQAMDALAAIDDPRAIPPLAETARRGTTQERRAAVRTLGEIGGPEVAEEIIRAAKSWNPVDAWVAFGALLSADLGVSGTLGASMRGLAGPLGMLYLPVLALGVALLVRKLRPARVG